MRLEIKDLTKFPVSFLRMRESHLFCTNSKDGEIPAFAGMTRKFYFLLYLFVIATSTLLNYSCKDSMGIEPNVKIIPEPALIKPLNLGDSWTYLVTDFDSLGNKISSDNVTNLIISNQIINGETWFVEKQGSTTPDITTTQINRPDGLWSYNSTNGFKIVSYPITLNEEFTVNQYTDNSGTLMEIIRKAIAVNITIHVPAGKFQTIKYIDRLQKSGGETINPNLNILYYAPNVGLVYTERYIRSKSGKILLFEKQELVISILK
jgi:hypothetical protein